MRVRSLRCARVGVWVAGGEERRKCALEVWCLCARRGRAHDARVQQENNASRALCDALKAGGSWKGFRPWSRFSGLAAFLAWMALIRLDKFFLIPRRRSTALGHFLFGLRRLLRQQQTQELFQEGVSPIHQSSMPAP